MGQSLHLQPLLLVGLWQRLVLLMLSSFASARVSLFG
jgi:hypothetical protein